MNSKCNPHTLYSPVSKDVFLEVSSTWLVSFTVCFDRLPNVVCDFANMTRHANGTCYNDDGFIGLWNNTIFRNTTGIKRVSASQEYYKYVTSKEL